MTKKVNFKRNAEEMKVDLSLALSEIVEGIDTIKNYLDLLVFVDDNCKMKDPYTEQRKWIGKLCWFWDNQEEYKFVGILGEISDNGTYFQKGGIVSYLNCEPIKPDDDIIYKGE